MKYALSNMHFCDVKHANLGYGKSRNNVWITSRKWEELVKSQNAELVVGVKVKGQILGIKA